MQDCLLTAATLPISAERFPEHIESMTADGAGSDDLGQAKANP